MTPEEALEAALRGAGAIDGEEPWWLGIATMTSMMIAALRQAEDPDGYFGVDFFDGEAPVMHALAVESSPHAMREVIRWALGRLEQMERARVAPDRLEALERVATAAHDMCEATAHLDGFDPEEDSDAAAWYALDEALDALDGER